MRGRLTDFVTDALVLGVYIRPRLSHSNSLGNDAEKDTAGCRAFNRKYIVIEGILHGKDTTTFNRNTINFNHSVYVKGKFFSGKENVSLSNASQKLMDKLH